MKPIPKHKTRSFATLWLSIILLFSFSTLLAQNWRLVDTKYPTIDNVVIAYSVADFGVTGDGVTDVTQQFQNALNQLGALGGGTLFVPEGQYVIKGNLMLPKGITLRGEWKKPERGAPVAGTILMAYAGRGDEQATPFITMEPSSAVMDLVIWYPEQTPSNITPYPPTVEFGKPNYFGNENCNAKNITLINSYAGIVFSRKNGGTCPTINGVYGTPLSRGIEIDNIVDVGRIEWIDFSPDYWAGSGLPNSPSIGGNHKAWIYENGTGIVMRRNDWSYTCFVNIEGYNKGFHAVESITSPGTQPNGHNYSMTFTNCKTGLDISAANSVGLMCTGIKTVKCETGIAVQNSASGVVQLHTCSLDATKNAILVDESASTRLMMLQSDINSGAVNVSGGTFTVTDSDFKNAAPQINITRNARAIITGNRFAQPVQIIQRSIFKNIVDHTPVSTKSLPEIMEVRAETHKPTRIKLYVATDAPYNAVANGTTDNTLAIQSALDQAAADGGGVVFLPPGKYKVLGHLVVPSNVELKGSVDVSTTPTGPGSILEVYADKNNPDGEPFLKLSAGSGIRGIVFNYPEQLISQLPAIAKYPYCIQATGSNTYMINIGMRAVHKGVDLFSYRCDNHYIDYMAGHAFDVGIRVGGGTTNGKIYNTQFNVIAYAAGDESKYGSWPNSVGDGGPAYDYGFAYFNFMILGNCKNQLLYNDFHYGSNNGVVLSDLDGTGPSGLSIGSGIDGSRNALVIKASGPDGFDFVNSQIVSIGNQNTKYIETGGAYTSGVTLFNADFWGNPSNGIYMDKGVLTLQQVNINQPGQQRMALLNGDTLHIEASSIYPINQLLATGTEPRLSIHSSIVDPSGIDKTKCDLWLNNMGNAPEVSTGSALSRSAWKVSASVNSGNAVQAIDGNPATRWYTGGPQAAGQWFTINFGKPEKIEQILLDVKGSPSDSPQKYQLFVSDNGTDWYGPGVSGAGADMMTVVSFPSTTVQYIRIVQTGSKGNWWSVHEAYAFGSELPVSVTGISLKEAETTLPVGGAYETQAALNPEDAANKIVFWKSSKTNIATVDNNGKVTGIASGVATITAVTMDGIRKANLNVIVGDGAVTGTDAPVDPDDDALRLFPNPASGSVTISYRLNKPQEVHAEVFNMHGLAVRTTTFPSNAGENQVSMPLEGFSPGVYLFRFRSAEGVQTKKLVKR
ncbi:discoidin domain-containing protein [Fulvivirgaceae bacterium PWU4]|uniref:Discoidin domain-containing protein n=1 Tax=Chryseosolibacter histidini TaxID=2782349 RepID=A0AAP2DPV4_9BACT|nr:glycosyl hydrolase family 28-related protein [Chryseosolibacter histidini]MBT1698129.1 discoidin domain-containing protein [Chryseosolibacter histidini]